MIARAVARQAEQLNCLAPCSGREIPHRGRARKRVLHRPEHNPRAESGACCNIDASCRICFAMNNTEEMDRDGFLRVMWGLTVPSKFH